MPVKSVGEEHLRAWSLASARLPNANLMPILRSNADRAADVCSTDITVVAPARSM